MARKGRIRKRETSSCCEPALFFDETSPWVKPAQGGERGEEGGKRDRHKVGLLVGRRVSSRSLTGRRGQEGVFSHPYCVERHRSRGLGTPVWTTNRDWGRNTKDEEKQLLCEVRSARQAPDANQAVAAEGSR